jgi:hypothetical protein
MPIITLAGRGQQPETPPTRCMSRARAMRVSGHLYTTHNKLFTCIRAVCYTLIELDECGEQRNGEVQKILEQITGRGTVPNVIVAGKCIGGGMGKKSQCNIVRNSHKSSV